MPNSTNYSIPLPADTDLVKDGASAMRSMGNSIDSTIKALNPETTLGDISYQSSTANTKTRLPIGSAGQVLGISGGVPAWVSSGSITWTQRTGQTTLSGGTLRKIAYNGSNLYVAIGDQGILYTSPDGITWTSRTSGFGTNNILDVAFGNSLWVAVGANGTITTSTDGITWTARTANMGTAAINAVAYGNSLWVAVGANGGTTNTGGITYSSDGTTWTRKSQSLTVGSTYYGVVWNGTNWIVTADNSTNNALYASTPSGTWTAVASGSANRNGYIYWDGTRHWYSAGASGSGSWWYSTSTTLSTSVETDQTAGTSTGALKVLYNGTMYVLGQDIFAFDVASSAILPNLRRVATNLPTFQNSSAGGTFNGKGLFVGAAGYIITDGSRFYTSF